MSALPLARLKIIREVEGDTRRTFEGFLVALFAGFLFWSAVAILGAAIEWW